MYYRIDLKSITDVQAAIKEVGAVYVFAYTHQGWNQVPARSRPPSGHQDLPLIPFDGRPSETDGHSFALVGFNGQGFVLQNSWGKGWGVVASRCWGMPTGSPTAWTRGWWRWACRAWW